MEKLNIIFHCMTLLIQVAYMFIEWFWYIRFPYGEVNIIFHCMTLLIQVAYMFIQCFCTSLSPLHTLTYMCFDELDTVESMRGYTMLCFMCPTVTGDGFRYSWTMRAHRYVIHVSKCYCWWWLAEFLVCIIKLNYKKPTWIMCLHPM